MEKRLGMIVAVEINAVACKYGQPKSREVVCGFEVTSYEVEGATLFICHTGEGEIAASAGTMLLLEKYHVSLILNFGIVGGLTAEMGQYHVAVVGKVVHYGFDTSSIDPVKKGQYPGYDSCYMSFDRNLIEVAKSVVPGLKEVTCASGDKFVGDPKEKAALHEEWNADICEMEAAAILLIANRAKVPSLSIKMVSDSVTGGAKEFIAEKERSASACLEVISKIIESL